MTRPKSRTQRLLDELGPAPHHLAPRGPARIGHFVVEPGSQPELARLRGPIGLDLGGRAPAETALAIMAEIVAERHDGSGVPLHRLRRAGASG